MNLKECPTCGAKAGEPCIVTLSDNQQPLSIKWQHRAREEQK